MRLIDADRLMLSLNDNYLANSPTGNETLAIQDYRESICEGLEIAMATVEGAPTVGGWIPFVKRPLTDDEQKMHPDWCYILEGSVPEDGEEILLYRPWKNSEGYIIAMDQYMNNGTECYLDGAGDIENGMFWMPLPKPPKEES